MKKQVVFSYDELLYSELSESERGWVDQVIDPTVNRSYAPYSHFSVVALVVLDNGKLFWGANQENASYPCGICAERVALSAAAVSENSPVSYLIISARDEKGDLLESPITPCGMCRQVMVETEKRYGKEMTVLLCAKDRYYRIKGASNLLPLQFDL